MPEWAGPTAVKLMLTYVYGKETNPIKLLQPSNTTIPLVCQLLRLSDFYELDHLKSLSEVWFADNDIVDVMNVVGLLTHAHACKARQLEAYAVYCCREMFSVVGKTEDWAALDPGLKKRVLSLDAKKRQTSQRKK